MSGVLEQDFLYLRSKPAFQNVDRGSDRGESDSAVANAA